MTTSQDIETQIMRLQEKKHSAQDREARTRCREIFGTVPRDYGKGIEEMFGAVARVYCRRAYGYRCDDLEDWEWIKKWHEYEPKSSVKELIETAEDYIADGCGVRG